MTQTRVTSWRAIVLQADPSQAQSDKVIEYEFTASGYNQGNSETHEGGKRVFRGKTSQRGPYAD